jgi:hypothetical protein
MVHTRVQPWVLIMTELSYLYVAINEIQKILVHTTLLLLMQDIFTLVNTRQFYSSRRVLNIYYLMG